MKSRLVLALWLGASIACSGLALGGDKQQREEDRQIAIAVCNVVEKMHFTRHKIDDEISARLHKQYLKLYDPMKLYFTQSDIDEFAKDIDKHDDELSAGDLGFAFTVYKRFIIRLHERAAWVEKLLNEKHDFAKEESIVNDPDSATWAKDDAEAMERWRVRVKYDLMLRATQNDKPEKARERIQRRYKTMVSNYDKLSSEEISELYLDALTTSFDPHSTYMAPKTQEDFDIAIKMSLNGIGALLSGEDGTTSVREIVAGGPAEKDGRLKPGDKIVAVGQGKDGTMTDVVEMKLRDVVKLIRGKAGSSVRLEIVTEKSPKPVVYEFVRQRIELEDKAAKGEIVETAKTASGVAYRVGVIKLPSFYADNEGLRLGRANAKSATADVRRILDGFKRDHVDAVVVDLRMNGGGLLNEAISLTGLFIPPAAVVQVRESAGKVTVLSDDGEGAVYTGPLVVLVNKLSASASEIFAGAIQDYNRGLVIGDSSTHGKGTVQKVYDLGRVLQRMFGNDFTGAVKLTEQKFYRVNGQTTQNRGVASDIVLPAITDSEEFGEAKLDYALDFDRIDSADYKPTNNVNPELIKHLRQQSGERVEKTAELQKLVRQKKQIDERRAQKTLVVSEARLRKDKDDFKGKDKIDDEDEDDDAAPKAGPKKKKVEKFGVDPYGKEVLAITSDLVRLKDSAFTQTQPVK